MVMMKTFFDSDAVYTWFCSFINMERGLGGKAGEHFRLDRMKLLAEMAGNPERRVPVIHIAGSKGKGSVCAMAGAALEAAGKSPGRYLSPHVVSWRERVCQGGGYFPEAVYVEAGNELFGVYENYRSRAAHGEATFFELVTLFFFICSRTAHCDCMVVETGIGGSFDATNIVEPAVSVITAIEKEHTEYLGDSVEKIAGEKAGIIKHGAPVILARQSENVLAVFRKKALEQEAPLLYLPEFAAAGQVRLEKTGTRFSLRFADSQFADLSSEYTTGVPGCVYPENAALALLAAKKAFPALGKEAARAGLAAFRLPARFEAVKVGEDTAFILDGAHTPNSVSLCAETFLSLYGEGGDLLFGCAKEKETGRMAEILVPHFSRIIITSPGKMRPGDPEGAYRAFLAAAGSGHPGQSIRVIPDTETAVTEALRLKSSKPILACGSFYLAGEIHHLIKPCEQEENRRETHGQHEQRGRGG
jgi:dihydrofolate synthase/folylpolyglutamate synthase